MAPIYDLPSALSANFKDGIQATIYGLVSAVLERPSGLAKGILIDGDYLELEVFAIKMRFPNLEHSSTGKNEEAFFVKGTIGIVAPTGRGVQWLGKAVEVTNAKGYENRIKWQQGLYTHYGYSAFSFGKRGADWVISPNRLQPIGPQFFKSDELAQHWAETLQRGKISHPVGVEANAPFFAVKDRTAIATASSLGVSAATPSDTFREGTPPAGTFEDTNSYTAPDPWTLPTEIASRPTKNNPWGTPAIGRSTPPEVPQPSTKRKINGLYHSLSVEKPSPYLDLILEEVEESRSNIEKMILLWKEDLSPEKYPLSDQITTQEKLVDLFQQRAVYGYGEKIGRHRGSYFLDKLADTLIEQGYDEKKAEVLSEKLQMANHFTDLLDPHNQEKALLLGSVHSLSIITGIDSSKIFSSTQALTDRFGVSGGTSFQALLRNPHVLSALLGGLSFEDSDKILSFAGALGIPKSSPGAEVWADTNMIVQSFNTSDGHSTRKGLNEIGGSFRSRSLGSANQETGTPFSGSQVSIIHSFLGTRPLSYQDLGYPFQGDYLSPRGGRNSNPVGLATNSGLLTFFEDSNTYELTSYVYKEAEIYRILQEKGSRFTGISDSDIQEAIAEYQEAKGFQLEQLQKDGVHLVKHGAGVLSGCAGSGKTTVSEVMVMALKKGLPGWNIKFAAPTGKAARRLSEVVGPGVKTLHSLFKLGIGSNSSVLFDEEDELSQDENTVYIFDEMAMANTDLLFQALKRLPFNSIVYFLGDVKQLPPIGKGIPFQDMMQFLPVVELGVSKRAAEGSGINFNCDIINSGDNSRSLEERADFHIQSSRDMDIPLATISAVRKALETYSSEEVQVVTPYQTDKKLWSTTRLNPLLQDVFPVGKNLFEYRNTTFRKGERVIHTNSNKYFRRRYVVDFQDENWVDLREVETHGVVNGEMGKIIGVIPSDSVGFEMLDTRDEDLEKKLRNDSKARRGTLFILFEVYDVDLDAPVVLLYHVKQNHQGTLDYPELYGGDFGDVQLAYALTTHKMQGSQAKCVIIPMGSSDNPCFVNRNMVYTAISRASSEVYLLGSVEGPSSALAESRKHTTGTDTVSTLSFLLED